MRIKQKLTMINIAVLNQHKISNVDNPLNLS